jgi:hypothetical protein
MMSNVCAPPRDYQAPPAREREPKKLEDSDETDEVSTKTDDDDNKDGTRSVQDLIAAAIKMFAKAEPKIQPAPVEVPAINLAVAPTIEAAVQQVLDQISMTSAKPEDKTSDDSSSSEKPVASATPDAVISVEPQVKLDAPIASKGPVATTAVRDPAPLPENPNPSHMHLVIADGDGQRMVVTVAVRGNEVNATIRGGDEQTAASIARNAASLDHALRAGGLDLSSFTSERDLDHHAPREQAQREQQEHEFTEDLT